jgi:hypothetical protein
MVIGLRGAEIAYLYSKGCGTLFARTQPCSVRKSPALCPGGICVPPRLLLGPASTRKKGKYKRGDSGFLKLTVGVGKLPDPAGVPIRLLVMGNQCGKVDI